MKKEKNIKNFFNSPTIKKLKPQNNQMEDKEISNSYDIDAVEFLDHIKFDNSDFDDNAIDYIEESK